jgi:hypothetical protein
MTGRGFSLVPFSSSGASDSFQVTGEIARRPDALAVHYELLGPLDELAIPGPAAAPTRRDGLWEETCFELFLAVKNSPRYWEFNLSPSGHWNAYRFSDYRKGMEEEVAYGSLPFDIEREQDVLRLAAEIDLSRIVPANRPLEIGISAVMKFRGGETAYWALTHPGPGADFHRRESFSLEL